MSIPWSNRANTYTEISLHGQISEGRDDQLCRILAGLTAMPPQRLIERHIIFSPARGPSQLAAQIGGTQNIQDAAKRAVQKAKGDSGDAWYLQLVENVEQGSTPETNATTTSGSNGISSHSSNDKLWSLRLYGLPEAGKRATTVRSIVEDEVQGDPNTFMDGIGYNFLSEHILSGQQFVQGNTVLTLHRVLRCPPRLPPDTTDSSTSANRSLSSAPLLSECSLLDESGAYVLEAKVRVQDGKNPESMSRGTQELLAFKERMRGIVDLRVVDRLALDTRVKSVARAA